MKAVVLALLVGVGACGGCDYRFDQVPRQQEAMVLVWNVVYGSNDYDYPQIEWITQESLDCVPDSNGRFTAFWRGKWYGDTINHDRCVYGVTWEIQHVSQVNLPDGYALHQTSMSHELLHDRLRHMNGDSDPDHKNQAFGLDWGHEYGLLDQANDELKNAGM